MPDLPLSYTLYTNLSKNSFNPYNIAYNCTSLPDTTAFVSYLNRPALRAAIHAPNKTYQDCNSTVLATLTQELVEPPAYNIIPAIIEKGICVHIYSGDYDLFLNHWGSELAIQNMTWGGLQGFQEKPVRPFLVDGEIMGNWGYGV